MEFIVVCGRRLQLTAIWEAVVATWAAALATSNPLVSPPLLAFLRQAQTASDR